MGLVRWGARLDPFVSSTSARPGVCSRITSLAAAAAFATGALTFVLVGPLTQSARAATTGGCDAGCVYGWGADSVHQADAYQATPNGVVAISASSEMGMALTWDGRVFAWGDDEYGQTNVPAGLPKVKAIAAGGDFAAVLTTAGKVVAWGSDQAHQTEVPTAAQSGVVAIAAGLDCVIALKSDGGIVAWGDNGYGQLNIPWVPKTIGGKIYFLPLSNLKAVSASGQVLGLKPDGTVVAWGWNNHGQASVPSGLSGVTAVAAGYSFSLALRSDGSIVAWGSNASGQLNVPCKLYNFITKQCVQLATGFTAIAAGNNFGLALRSDGSVVAWGDNTYGQATFPGDRDTSRNFAIAAGSDFSLGVWKQPGPPDPPGAVSASAGNSSALVTFYGNGQEGGAPVTVSTVTSSPGGKTCTAAGDFNGPKSCIVWGLTNGTTYTFTVTATTGLGTSAPSAPSNPVTPTAG